MMNFMKKNKIILCIVFSLIIIGVCFVAFFSYHGNKDTGFLKPDYTVYNAKPTTDIKKISDEQLSFALTLSEEELASASIATFFLQDNVQNGYQANTDILLREYFSNHYSNVYSNFENSDDIFLSFSLDYELGFTSQILDTLKENDVTAVFFITIDYARQRPDLVDRMIDDNQIIGFLTPSYYYQPESKGSYMYDNSLDIAKDLLSFHDFMADNFNYRTELVTIAGPYGSLKLLTVIENLDYKIILPDHNFTDEHYPPDCTLGILLDTNYGGSIKSMNFRSGSIGYVLNDYITETKKKHLFSNWKELKSD